MSCSVAVTAASSSDLVSGRQGTTDSPVSEAAANVYGWHWPRVSIGPSLNDVVPGTGTTILRRCLLPSTIAQASTPGVTVEVAVAQICNIEHLRQSGWTHRIRLTLLGNDVALDDVVLGHDL